MYFSGTGGVIRKRMRFQGSGSGKRTLDFVKKLEFSLQDPVAIHKNMKHIFSLRGVS